MNLERILNMIIRQVMRRFISGGINKGMNMATRRGKAPEDTTVEDQAQAASARDAAKRARKAQQRATGRNGRP